jgi:hypothetical protein
MELASREFGQWCFDHGVRIGTIIAVGCCHDGEDCIGALEDLIRDNENRRLAKIFSLPSLMEPSYEIADDDGEEPRHRRESVLQHLAQRDLNGFLVTVEQVVRTYDRRGRSFTFSWGHYRSEQIYTALLDSAFVHHLMDRIEKDQKKEKREAEKSKVAS